MNYMKRWVNIYAINSFLPIFRCEDLKIKVQNPKWGLEGKTNKMQDYNLL